MGRTLIRAEETERRMREENRLGKMANGKEEREWKTDR